MSESTDKSDRTEPPTAKRRTDSRKKGKVALSKELSTAVLLMGAVLMLEVAGPLLTDGFKTAMADGLTLRVYENVSVTWAIQRLTGFFTLVLPALALFAGTLFFVASAIGISQAGLKISFHPMQPTLTKISPLAGLKRMFSYKGLMSGFVAFFKFLVLGSTLYFNIRGDLPVLLQLQGVPLVVAVLIIARLAIKVLWWIAVPLLFIGLIDYIYQRWDNYKEMKMSKQEIKDETKSEQGDPELKARIKRAQREIATRRMMEKVPSADVVITNPTHFAVALRYDKAKMNAPTVVAKGVDEIAFKIREIAEENDVPIMEDPPLARALFRSCDIDQQIPPDFYQAVATVLAHVLSLKQGAA